VVVTADKDSVTVTVDETETTVVMTGVETELVDVVDAAMDETAVEVFGVADIVLAVTTVVGAPVNDC